LDIHQRYLLFREIESGLDSISWPVNAYEPDYVARLVIDLPDIIKRALSTVCPERFIKVGGAFIHQKPIVHFLHRPGMKDPELGDLLIVCREKRSHGTVCNAMFLQAKCFETMSMVRIPKDHQFILYSEWPEFEYKRAGKLNGKRRSVLPKTITQGAQYLLFDKNEPSRLFTATVDLQLKPSSLFAFTMASIMTFDEGRTFQLETHRDDWSQMVLDMFSLLRGSKFTRQRGNFHGEDRLRGDQLYSYIMDLADQRGEPESFDTNSGGDNQNGMMGILCIDLGEEKE
jgi:hypothetical protein